MVHHGAAAMRGAMQARDRRAVREHFVQQTHAPQRGEPCRLQQEAGADRTRGRCLFEDLDAMPSREEREGSRLAAVPYPMMAMRI
jgi:hypothetical protein